jgi:anti-sigma regulatory factor (Ser/Thr protein kinase)
VTRVASGFADLTSAHTKLFGPHGGRPQTLQGDQDVTGQAAGPVWPTASPPAAAPLLSWELDSVAELPHVRAELRRHTAPADRAASDLRDQLILALDEMASNALRHGGGGVRAMVRQTANSYLVEVSDLAASSPPTPAVGRDPSEGGLGLYLIAEMATEHGWYVEGGAKHVWALLPRR